MNKQREHTELVNGIDPIFMQIALVIKNEERVREIQTYLTWKWNYLETECFLSKGHQRVRKPLAPSAEHQLVAHQS